MKKDMLFGITREYDSIVDYISRDFTIKAKKLVGFPIVWLLYYSGYLISRIPNFYYPVYNKLMIWSSEIQDWAKLTSPWKTNRYRETKIR